MFEIIRRIIRRIRRRKEKKRKRHGDTLMNQGWWAAGPWVHTQQPKHGCREKYLAGEEEYCCLRTIPVSLDLFFYSILFYSISIVQCVHLSSSSSVFLSVPEVTDFYGPKVQRLGSSGHNPRRQATDTVHACRDGLGFASGHGMPGHPLNLAERIIHNTKPPPELSSTLPQLPFLFPWGSIRLKIHICIEIPLVQLVT